MTNHYNKGKIAQLLHSHYDFLRAQAIPMTLRVSVFTTVIYPAVCYGGELFGGSVTRAKKANTAVGRGLKLIIGKQMKNNTGSTLALIHALNVMPVHVTWKHNKGEISSKGPEPATSNLDPLSVGQISFPPQRDLAQQSRPS